MKRIVFDVETEQFSAEFREATSDRVKTRLAPRMRVCCTYEEPSGRYRYFGPRQSSALVRLLQSADEIVSFNGKHFDVLVLRRHCGLKGRLPIKGRHIDLCEIMTGLAGFRIKLDLAVSLNLDERKHTDGRKMDALNPEDLELACRSDVCQTYRLYQRYLNGTLLIPERRSGWQSRDRERSYSSAPVECPSCHARNCLEETEWETDNMTEGQLAEYLAGNYGTAECRLCGEFIDWGL